MKVTVEKVPQGVKVSVTTNTAKAPMVFIIQPGQLGLLTTMLETAMKSDVFKFEMQL